MSAKTKTKIEAAMMTSWDDVNAALACLGKIEPQVTRLQNRADEIMARTQERYAKEIVPLQAEIASLAKGIGEFVHAHRKDLTADGDGKFRDLPNGRVELRLSPPRLATLSRVTWDMVVERIAELPQRLRARFIRVKETLDKDELKVAIISGDVSEEQRSALGVAIAQDETPYYEVVGR